MLPNKSKYRYNEVYEKVLAWLSVENVIPHEVSDDVLFYLSNFSKTTKQAQPCIIAVW